jgi:excisionase family DNA binding protein
MVTSEMMSVSQAAERLGVRTYELVTLIIDNEIRVTKPIDGPSMLSFDAVLQLEDLIYAGHLGSKPDSG